MPSPMPSVPPSTVPPSMVVAVMSVSTIRVSCISTTPATDASTLAPTSASSTGLVIVK